MLVTQSRSTLCDLKDCSSFGSSVHGILQARILEWVYSLLWGIFLTQGSYPGLLHCRQTLSSEPPGDLFYMQVPSQRLHLVSAQLHQTALTLTHFQSWIMSLLCIISCECQCILLQGRHDGTWCSGTPKFSLTLSHSLTLAALRALDFAAPSTRCPSF